MDTPYGFIIYRGDYGDDAQWERYMAYLKHQTRTGLEDEGEAELFDLMDWKVISSPDMQDEDPDEIRERFRKWLQSGEEKFDANSYRHRACLYVNQACLECLDLFMEDKSLETDDPLTLCDISGITFGILVSRRKHEDWVMVGMSYLMPNAGDTIMEYGSGCGWHDIYVPQGDVCVNF
ncbi:hypothetical protein K504DRAFT_534567 [Pleomassaria siparia CBS 279.74]|uniref:Uncharacterized protein n=1 Tax=Pleomassaria siparia CBS 279.74 TaxID=1314801 RepID=A0A6G1K910_9PLEO|nr:hypothetical protein K504DRAFT_534567 [Pleomassaria siparia CBS 279.74]